MSQVFISYRHVQPDEDLAGQCAHFLEANGFSAFVDKRVRIGQDWVEEINRQLHQSQYFVVLLSAESIRSDMVGQEIRLAHKLRKEGRLSIFPVRIAFAGELPYDLGAYLNVIQYKSWKQGQPFDLICKAILQEIQQPPAGPQMQEVGEASPESLHLLAEATELRGAPLPGADPRLETGAVELDSPFYVRRSTDDRIAKLITQRGITILVKGPRQVGKTSLLARVQALARENGQRTLYIDFQLIDESNFESLKGLLLYFAHRIARELRTTIKPKDVWDDMLGGPESLTSFVEDAALQGTEIRLSIILDEVDRIFRYECRNGFFAMVRAWHNFRASNPLWKRVNLQIGHSTEAALFMDDINQSPFNVGEVLRLSDFSPHEVERLNEAHGRPLQTADEIEKLMKLVGGHPFLVRQSLYSLRTGIDSLEALIRVAADDRGPFGDHLRRHLWVLRGRERVREALKQVIRHGDCSDELDFQRLRAAGLVEGDWRESARLRCDLYRQYFTRHL